MTQEGQAPGLPLLRLYVLASAARNPHCLYRRAGKGECSPWRNRERSQLQAHPEHFCTQPLGHNRP
jgi:hypothetical protein